MEKLYKNITKLPDTMKEIISFDKNGKRFIKSELVKDRYLLTLNNGNSVAISSKDFSKFGINSNDIKETFVKKEETVEQKPENSEKTEEVLK